MSNPKILHIGLCVYRDKESSITKAFKGATDNYLELSLSEKHLQQRSIQLAEAFRPDLVFLQIQADNILHLDTVKEIKKHSRTVINWTGDVRSPLQPFFLPMAKEIDYTCFTNMRDVNFIRSKGYGAEFVQIGYDETIYYPNVSRGTKDIDIVFMGNNYGNQFPLGKQRIEMVNYLRANYGNRFKVFGNFHKADGNVNHSQEEEAAIYRRAKLAISMSHFNIERYFSDRLLRIMGCGVPCLSHAYEGWETDFNKEEIVIWETFEDLKSKIDYYLANETERERIATNGENLVRNRNTFNHMVQDLIKLIK